MYDAGNPKPVFCNNLERWLREGGGRGFRRERSHVCLWPIHTDV